MPKISKHCGPSHKGEPRPQPPAPKPAVKVRVDVTSDERLADLLRQVVEAEASDTAVVVVDGGTVDATGPDLVAQTEGGEQSSPGSSSSASTPKQPTSTEPSKPARRRPARSTGSRSVQGQTGSSSASLTAGALTEPTSATE